MQWWRSRPGKRIAITLFGVVVLAIYMVRGDMVRDRRLRETVDEAQPVIDAIGQYERDHGRPPEALTGLSPKYLAKLPVPTASQRGEWFYECEDHSEEGFGTGGDRWVLGIEVHHDPATSGLSLGDMFVYRPGGRYERGGYGGALWKRYGAWAYYSE